MDLYHSFWCNNDPLNGQAKNLAPFKLQFSSIGLIFVNSLGNTYTLDNLSKSGNCKWELMLIFGGTNVVGGVIM